ncbi:MAG: NUDIX hydrolase [Balneolaceae bacterium]
MKSTLWKDAGQFTEQPLNSVRKFNGRLLQVYLDTVRLPDGLTSTREWIRHPGACAVVPVFEDGTIMLVKQFRYPSRQIFYEVPAGKIDPGEPEEVTAVRETAEETGLQVRSCRYIGHFYPGIGYSDEIIHIYAAWDLSQQPEKLEDDEFLVTHRLPFSEAVRMVELGEISDAKTICSLLKTKLWWEKNNPFYVSFS